MKDRVPHSDTFGRCPRRRTACRCRGEFTRLVQRKTTRPRASEPVDRDALDRPDPLLARLITPREHAVAMELVWRVRRGVPAELWRALLFGSRARGEGRPDSDLDVLLVFRALPFDRE